MNRTPSQAVRCPECGGPLSASSVRGLCPRCLVIRALAAPAPVPAEAGTFTVPDVEELNALFGGLEVRTLLGRGGMGAVYEAWQKDLARPVALKVLPPHLMDGGDFVERFRREAQSMARLDHPNVARVYETGFTDAGEPYMVMELIRGEPITAHADRRGLGLRERVELWIAVCAGVQHAHQKGLIHRDLKPSNVLVGEGDGHGQAVVKVIDFGLARPVGDAAGDASAWRSQGVTVGTPAYLSPEQAAGGEVDTRTDIYSLGALGLELLTGRPPGEPWGCVAGRAGLTPELAAILRKALAPVPADRYATVAALADDLGRLGRSEPVEAMGRSKRYRAGAFLRRHRAGVAVATASVLLLLGGLGLLGRYSVLARRAEHLADARLRQGEQLIEFLLGDLHARLSHVGRLDVMESAIREVEKYYDRPEAGGGAESLRNRARARLAIGRVRNAQGRRDLARAGYEEAIRWFGVAAGMAPDRPIEAEHRVQAWNSLAVLHHVAGEFVDAERAYREGLAINAVARQLEPENVGWIDTRASLLHNLGAMYDAAGRLEDAERTYGEALALWEPVLAKHPDQPELWEHLADFRLNLSFVLQKRGRFEEAERANMEALRLQEKLVERDPENMTWLHRLAGTQQNIAELHFREGRLEDAEAWMNRYRPLRERIAARDPANSEWQQVLADAHVNHALLSARRGNDEAAAESHRKAWEVAEPWAARWAADAEWRRRRAEALTHAAAVFERLAERGRAAGDTVAERRNRAALEEVRGKLLQVSAGP